MSCFSPKSRKLVGLNISIKFNRFGPNFENCPLQIPNLVDQPSEHPLVVCDLFRGVTISRAVVIGVFSIVVIRGLKYVANVIGKLLMGAVGNVVSSRSKRMFPSSGSTA